MKEELLKILKCPACKGKFDLKIENQTFEIKEGELKCRSCASVFKISNGIVILIKHTEIDESKKKEIEGWKARRRKAEKTSEVKVEKEQTEYQSTSYLLSLPYINKTSLPERVNEAEIKYWENVSSCFDICLKRLSITKNLRLLEVGAGSGWASKRFSDLGCNVVAMDLSIDNLTDANHFIELTDSYFERIVGDFENIPFENSFFDVVFACATLHHSAKLSTMIGELKRVLKKGGVIFVINEPMRPITRSENYFLEKNEEKKLGINEHIYSFFQYKYAFLRNLMPSRMFLMEFESKNSFESILNWLESQKQFKFRVCNLFMRRTFLKPALEFFWILFMSGNLNIYAKKI